MTAELTLLAALTLGLLGSSHCIAMCGGISAMLASGGRSAGRLQRAASYNFGRLASYALAGALVGLFGGWVGQGLDLLGFGIGLRVALGMTMIAIGAHLAFNWGGLRRLESLGAAFWRRLAPLARRLLPARTPLHAFGLGMLWGWLPCGLVYTALLAAAVSGGALQGALVMLAFGAGTLPALLAIGALGQRLAGWMQRQGLRRLAGASILAFGVWTLATPTMHLLGGGHSGGHAPDEAAPMHQPRHPH
jgi:uncharacterized protein